MARGKKRLTHDIDFDKNQLLNAVLHPVADDIANPATGQVWLHSGTSIAKVFDGVSVKAIGEIEFRDSDTHVQWRLKGSNTWQNLTSKFGAAVSKAFVNTNTVTVAHNMGKMPAVTVVDENGNTRVSHVKYNDTNSLTVSFNSQLTGVVYCN